MSSATWLFTEKHVHFSTPDHVTASINQTLFKFLLFLFHKEYSKFSKNLNTVFVSTECLLNANDVKSVHKALYIVMIDSLRQRFYPRMRQAGRERKISDSHRKGYSFLMHEKYQGVQQLYCKTVIRFVLND